MITWAYWFENLRHRWAQNATSMVSWRWVFRPKKPLTYAYSNIKGVREIFQQSTGHDIHKCYSLFSLHRVRISTHASRFSAIVWTQQLQRLTLSVSTLFSLASSIFYTFFRRDRDLSLGYINYSSKKTAMPTNEGFQGIPHFRFLFFVCECYVLSLLWVFFYFWKTGFFFFPGIVSIGDNQLKANNR